MKDFKKYEKTVYSIAWDFAKKYNEEVEDLIQEGWLLYYKAISTYDENKTKFNTHLHNTVWCGISDHLRMKTRRVKKDTEDIEEIQIPVTDISKKLIEFYADAEKTLSQDAQTALEFILSEQWRKPGMQPSHFGKNTLKRFLNWTDKKTRTVWDELTIFMQENLPAYA